ncbi:hypothetical protein BX600DRAFT_517248 [Xylariales sp. PMI_506]|nr:hypothetical protein BX600DRAFT_517248 [Xylariales sp. PMI_506]
MDPAAIVSNLQMCYKVGSTVVDICKTWKNASKEVEVYVLAVESCWARTEMQVDILKPIARSIDANHRRILSDQLVELADRLTKAIKDLDSVVQRESDASASKSEARRHSSFVMAFGLASRARIKARRAAWVWKKDAIDTVVRDLLDWHAQFDPLWLLIVRNPNPVIKDALERGRANEQAIRPAGSASTFAHSPLTLAANLHQALMETQADNRPSRRQHHRQPQNQHQSQQKIADLRQGVQTIQLQQQQQYHAEPNQLPSPTLKQRRSMFRDPVPMEIIDIPYSDAQLAQRPGDPSWVILDTIECKPGVDVKVLADDVRALATKLACSDPLAFGLLNCKGVVRVPQPRLGTARGTISPVQSHSFTRIQPDIAAFQLVFRSPDSMEVLRSLRDLLLNTDKANMSLSRRLSISRELAKAVSYVHTFAFVHKNIRPESVLYSEEATHTSNYENQPFPEDNDGYHGYDSVTEPLQPARSHAFLVGFDAFRAADGVTMMTGDVNWDRSVYRHPLRQGTMPADQYRMHHDVYSLGVCMLEVGLWESFIEYDPPPAGGGRAMPRFGRSYANFQAWLDAQPVQRQRPGSMSQAVTTSVAFRLKDYLVELARTRLPSCMGERYTNVVLACLTCLDEDVLDGNDDYEDDIQVAVRFNETIMRNLNEICI